MPFIPPISTHPRGALSCTPPQRPGASSSRPRAAPATALSRRAALVHTCTLFSLGVVARGSVVARTGESSREREQEIHELSFCVGLTGDQCRARIESGTLPHVSPRQALAPLLPSLSNSNLQPRTPPSRQTLPPPAHPELRVFVITERTPVTMDYRLDRVRVVVDDDGVVVKPPRQG